MQCVTPMLRMYQTLPLETRLEMKRKGEKQFNRIIPNWEVLGRLNKDENYFTRIDRINRKLEKQGSLTRYQLIPCKKCWACRLNYSADWATRIMLECEKYEHNYFITLTYDNEHLPILEQINYKDSEGNRRTLKNDGSFTPTVSPRDLTRFINTLRKHFEREGHNGIKYFAAAEYGELNGRPHYHIIIMNCPLPKESFYGLWRDENYKDHYHNKLLEQIWKKGIVDVAFVEWSSAAYVARYGTKLFINGGTEEDYARLGKYKEFVRMSRNPAIGRDYYNNHVRDILETDEIIMKTVKGNVGSAKPPKYFDKLNDETYPEYFDQIKENRREAAERAKKVLKSKTNISDKEMYERKAEKLILKGNMLKRDHTEVERLQRI